VSLNKSLNSGGGKNGIALTEDDLKALMKRFGPDAKVEKVIKALKRKGKIPD